MPTPELSADQQRTLNVAAEITKAQYRKAREVATEIDKTGDLDIINTIALMMAVNFGKGWPQRGTPISGDAAVVDVPVMVRTPPPRS